MSRDPNLEYFSDGMTEALITALSKMSSLRVISRTSVMPYKRAGKPLPQIARELGVQFIVEGSVLHAGDCVRISAQLVHGARDQHVWADRYEGDFGEVLSLLEKTAMAVASAVAGKLGQPSTALSRSPRKVAPDACKAYLMGRHEFYRYTEEGLLAAIGWYEKAIQIDPDFALAYSAMAHAYCAMVAPLATLLPCTLFGKAEVLARKALALDDSIAEARFSESRYVPVFVSKQRQDQVEAGAEHAILATTVFPAGKKEMCICLAAVERRREANKDLHYYTHST